MSSNQQHYMNNSNGSRHVYDITPYGSLVPSKGPSSTSFLTPPSARITSRPNSLNLNNSSKGSLHRSSNASSSSSSPINNGNSAKSQSQLPSPSLKVIRPENAEINKPKPGKICSFKVDDDVFYLSDDGKQHFGSVLKVSLEKRSCKLYFGDGNTTWAPFDRLEKFADTDNDEEPSLPPPPVQVQPKKIDSPVPLVVNKISNEPSGIAAAKNIKNLPVQVQQLQQQTTTKPSQNTSNSTNNNVVIKKSKSNNTKTSTSRKHELTDIVCVQCGKIESIRNVESLQQSSFRCFECFRPHSKRNKSVTPTKVRKSNTLSASVSSSTDSKIGNKLESKNNKLSLNKEVSKKNLEQHTGHGLKNNTSFTSNNLTIAQINELCFHCRQVTTSFNRVHCNLCNKPCHLLCLQLNPPPFDGDKFWDIICHHCGHQISPDSDQTENKIFSARRKIQSWSDVIVLLINCLTARDQVNGVLKLQSGQKEPKYFDLDKDILPFLNNNYTRFHLPRIYLAVAIDKRKETLLNAFNSPIFQNGKEYKKKGSLWGIRNVHNGLNDNHNHKQNNNVLKVVKEKKQMEIVPKMKIKIPPSSTTTSTSSTILQKSSIVQPNANSSAITTTTNTPQKSPIVHPNAKSILAKDSNTNTARIAGNKIILEQPKNSHQQTSEKIKMPSVTSTSSLQHQSNLLSSDVAEIANLLEGKGNQKKPSENEKSRQSAHASTTAITSSSTSSTLKLELINIDIGPPLKKLLTFSSVADFSKNEQSPKQSNKRKRNVVRYNKTSDSDTSNDDEDANNNKRKEKEKTLGLKGDTSSKQQHFNESSKKKHYLHSHSKYKITSPIKSTSKLSIAPSKTKSPLRKIGRPKNKVVVNGDVLTSHSTTSSTVTTVDNGNGVHQQSKISYQIATSTSTSNISNVQVVPSPTKKKKKKIVKNVKNVISGGHKRRGRPSLKPIVKKPYLDIDFTAHTNGLIPTITLNDDDNDGNANLELPHHYHQHSNSNVFEKKEAFNPCKKNLYENALFGYSTISCLPKAPKEPEDIAKMNLDMGNLLMSERQKEENEFKLWSKAHLDLKRSRFNQIDYSITSDDLSHFNYLSMYANKPKLRDLNDFDSYTITASRVDEDGLTRYHVVWNDGDKDKSEDDDENDENTNKDEVDEKTEVIQAEIATEAEKITHIPAADKSSKNVVPNGILTTCGEKSIPVSVQIPSTSTSSKDIPTTSTTKTNLNNVNQVNSVSNGALPTSTTTISTAAEVLSEIPKVIIKTPIKEIIPTPAIAIKIEKRDDDNDDIIVLEPKRRFIRKHVPFVDLTIDSP